MTSESFVYPALARRLAALSIAMAVGVAGVLTAVPAAAQSLTASISGTVTGSDSASGVPEVWVNVLTADGDYVDWGRTDEAGGYRFDDLQPGDYRLSFGGRSAGYLDEWWDDKPSFEASDVLELAAGDAPAVDVVLARGARIEGVVRDGGGSAVEEAVITLTGESGEWLDEAYSGEDGSYAILAVAPGTYFLHFLYLGDRNLAGEWWQDAPDLASATPIEITDAGTVVADAVLAAGGSIVGTVSADSPIGPGDGILTAYDANGEWAGQTTTDGDGSYAILNLATGEYTVRLQYTGPDSYSGQWYSGKASRELADPVSVVAGAATTADFTLVSGGSITGTVVAADTEQGLEDIGVTVTQNGVERGYTTTDADGFYAVRGLADGDYIVKFDDYSPRGYLTQWWDGAASPTEATVVSLTAGVSRVANAALRSEFGTLGGRVMSTSTPAVPVADVSVTLVRADGWESDTVRSGNDGRWSVGGLEPGTYYVEFEYIDRTEIDGYAPGHSTRWWGGDHTRRSAAPVEVSAGERSGADIALPVGATLRGSVRRGDAPTAGIEGVNVFLYGPSGQFYSSALTEQDGDFEFWTRLLPGSYTVIVHAPDGGLYDGSESTLTVGLAEDAVLDVVVPRFGSIGGTITGTDIGEAGLEGVGVSLVAHPGGAVVEWTQTDHAGEYEFTGLKPGEYRVNIEGCSYCSTGDRYAGIPWAGDPLMITAAGENRVVDRALRPLAEATASVWGHVTAGDGSGEKLAGILVSVYGLDGEYVAGDVTDHTGEFDIGGIFPGSYRLKYQCPTTCDYPALWAGGTFTPESADVITVEAGDRVVASRPMRVGGAIEGTVRGVMIGDDDGVGGVSVFVSRPDGKPIERALVNSTMTTVSDGYFRIGGLPPGDYLLQFSPSTSSAYPTQWWGPSATVENAGLVEVVTNSTTTANMWLHVGSSLSGTISAGPDGGDLTDLRVSIASDHHSVTRWLNAEGTYSVVGLPPGTYTVRVYGSGFPDATIGTIEFPEIGTPATLDYTFPASGRIAGTLVNPYGEPLDNVHVEVYEETGRSLHAAGSSTDDDGRFQTGPLLPGTYRLEYSCAAYSQCPFTPQWRGGALTPESSLAVVVGPGTTTLPVEEVGWLSGVHGRISAGGIAVTGGVTINFVDEAGRLVAADWLSHDDSDYHVALPPGVYRVKFDPYGHAGYAISWSAADTTAAGHRQLDLDLAPGAVISGRVTGSNNPTFGLAGVEVVLYDRHDRGAGHTVTDSDGRYEFRDVGAGDYTLRVWGSDGYHSQWHDGSPSGVGVSPFEVAPGADLTFDMTLMRADEVLPALSPSTPTIIGSPEVGSTLTAVAGTWGPGDVALAYQWRRNGSAIPGAAASIHLVTADDIGTALSVTVTGSRSGYQSASRTSPGTAVVAAGTVTSALPTVSGTARVGHTLTAHPGAWEPADVELSFQWNRDGTAIVGATGATYAPGPDDVGRKLTVTVIGSKEGMTSSERTSAPTVAVAAGVLTTAAPTIAGTAVVGEELAAVLGSWADDVEVAYEWRRGGSSITGATASNYTLVPADRGTAITVRVTVTKPGFTTVTLTSAAVKPKGALTASPVPIITGAPSVGVTLKATAGTWAPKTVTLKYQWLRDGIPISKATKSSYKLRAVDAESTISVRVTGSKSGYATVVRESAGLDILAMLAVTPVPTISGTAVIGETLTATAGDWVPADVDLAYQWKRNGVAIPDADSTTYTLQSADAGAKITVTVTGSKDGYTSISKTSKVFRPLKATPIPTIHGTVAVGSTLTAVPGKWTPSKVTLKYQWFRDGVAIPKATKAKYKLTLADADTDISVRVTGSNKGYATVARLSAAVDVPKVLTATYTPVISGDARVGATFTAEAGTWQPEWVQLDYQWKRNGKPIDGATQSYYDLVAADAGKKITVTVTGSKEGYTSVSKTSKARVVEKLLTPTPQPVITGTPAVGATLKVKTGKWGPGTVTFRYQWYRGGEIIPGATKSSYKVTNDDAGAALHVTVAASKKGYTTLYTETETITIP